MAWSIMLENHPAKKIVLTFELYLAASIPVMLLALPLCLKGCLISHLHSGARSFAIRLVHLAPPDIMEIKVSWLVNVCEESCRSVTWRPSAR